MSRSMAALTDSQAVAVAVEDFVLASILVTVSGGGRGGIFLLQFLGLFPESLLDIIITIIVCAVATSLSKTLVAGISKRVRGRRRRRDHARW